jgi:uncharacterized membrane protein (UPF0127 family)
VTSVASVRVLRRAVLAALLYFGAGFGDEIRAEAPATQPLTFITEAGRKPISVEVADSDEERGMGLMFRRSLADDAGMIFIYPQDGPISMWMKNTYIPLDMFFVRSDGTIHHIEQHTQPFSEETISSRGTVRAVIEMKAGSATRLGIKIGDKVDFPAFR